MRVVSRSGALVSGKRHPVSSVTMTHYADALARRIVPDALQVQVLLGTLLGAGRLVPAPDGFSLVLSLDARHVWLSEWTYERLAPLVPVPARRDSRVEIRSAPHPFFADLAALLAHPARLRRVVGERALWLWATHQLVRECEREAGDACTCARAAPPRSVWFAA